MNPQMQNYRQYPQAQARPQAARRPGQVPPNAQYAAQQAHLQTQQAQQRAAIHEHQQAQRRAKKPTDLNIPDGTEDLIIGNAVQQYKDLQTAERKLDQIMMRKRTELQDSVKRNVKRQKIMRIWISNTAENQPWQGGSLDENTFDFNSGQDPTYRVKVEGKLLEWPSDDPFVSDDEDAPQVLPEKPSKCFSHFFKSMHVEYDRARTNAADPSMQVEWKKQPNSEDIDHFKFQRRGDENMNITINLVRDEQPERFRLSHALADTLDMQEADRAEVIMGLWEYVKLFGLQEDDEKRSIRCDEQLRQIFGRDQVFFPQIPELIMTHLHPLPPVKLPYTIRVDPDYINGDNASEPTIYDIQVSVDDPIRLRTLQFLQNAQHVDDSRKIQKVNDEIAVLVQTLHHSKARHAFFTAMAKDPVGTTNKWLKSQRRDLEVTMGEAARGGGEDGMGVEFSRGGTDSVWGSEVVNEAVRYMLAKPDTTK